jgi:hypothetical protein
MVFMCFYLNFSIQTVQDFRAKYSLAEGAVFSGRRSRCDGFALVLALSLMAFVLVLILSLTTFLSVELQVSASGQDRMKARENAYLGAMVAMGDLQKYAGADQRSTARADLMADGNQLWTGVWHSNPLESDYDPAAWPVWLVSGEEDLAQNNPSDTMSLSDDGVVELLPAMGTMPAVLVRKLAIEDASGASDGSYAYWVGDEGVKAKFNKSDPNSFATSEIVDNRRITVAQRNGIEVVIPTYPVNDAKLDRAVSFDQFEVLTESALDAYYHDFTASSYALLTDPVSGGLKQDLSAPFQASSLPSTFAEHAVFVTPDSSIVGPRWEYLRDFYRGYEHINAAGNIYPMSAYDSVAGRKGALDVDSGNGSAGDPYTNITSENDVDGWVKHPYTALTTELGLVLSMSSGGDNLPVLRLHPFLELTNPYNITLEGGWYEYHISRFGPTVTFTFTSSTDANAPALSLSRKFYDYLEYDNDLLNYGSVVRMLVDADQTKIEPGRSIRLFPDGIVDASNLTSYTESGLPMKLATSVDNWDRGYLEVRLKSDSNTRWPDATEFAAHDYDTLSIQATFATSLEKLDLAFYLQRNTEGVANDSAIVRGSAYVRNVNTDNSYSFVKSWPGDPLLSQPFALVRGKVKSADEYSSEDSADFLGAFNPRSPLMNIKHGDSSDVSVRAWDWTFELGAVNPDFSTPGGADSGFGYWGPSNTTGEFGGFGPTRTVLYDLPREPLLSIGQFQNAMFSLYPHEPSYALGNSYAPKNGLSQTEWYGSQSLVVNGSSSSHELVDLSYALNTALWDHYYFSSVPASMQLADLNDPLPNSHIEIQSDLEDSDLLTELQISERAAAHLRINGGFNVNSVSVPAWAAILSSMAGLPIEDQASSTSQIVENSFLRFATPYNGAGNEWSGFRELLSDEIFDADLELKTLAQCIVDEIKERARSSDQGRPFISLAEFINRRLSSDDYGEMGVLQQALEDANINDDTNLFAPGSVTQADLLSALGPKLTSRSDTFVIRSYGETISPTSGDALATAMCEIVVERQPDYVEEWDGTLGDVSYENSDELSALNKQFGRRFKVTSFRWIN